MVGARPGLKQGFWRASHIKKLRSVETATPGEICRSAPYLIFPLLGRWNVHSSVLVAPAANVQAEFARQAQGGFPDQVAQVRQKEFAQHG
eukprot:s250_g8.t1